MSVDIVIAGHRDEGVGLYTVKQAAALTGITESSLRAWERRYAVVTPQRSSGGYRLYDETQLGRLRAMSALVRAGVPASRAAEAILLTAGREHDGEHGPEAGRDAAVRPGRHEGDDLVAAAQSLDPDRLDALLVHKLAEDPVERVADAWLLPELRRVGEAWQAGELTIPQGHFLTASVLRVLHGHFGTALRERGRRAGSAGGHHAPTMLLGLPPGARHELGLLAFAVGLQRRGLRVIYLGADVPEGEWVRVVGEVLPRGVVLAVARREDVPATQSIVDLLRAVTPPVRVVVGGSARHGVRNALLLPDSLTEAATILDTSMRAGVSLDPQHAPTVP